MDWADVLIICVSLFIAYAVLVLFVRAFWPLTTNFSDEQPNGDATETPQMMQQTRRVNHERRKA